MSGEKPSSSFGFKKRNFRGQASLRRRQELHSESDENEDDEQTGTVVRHEKRLKRANPNVQSTKFGTAKRNVKDADGSSVDGSDDENVNTCYRSEKSSLPIGPQDQGATSINEYETELDRDVQAIHARSVKINEELEGKPDDKLYRGINNYAQYYKKKDTAAGNVSSGMVRKGPIRAPAHLRSTVRWDYQPDVCKDFKETGYCGFGDSCKFLHDRSDYKAGWQLEIDYAAKQQGDGNENDEHRVVKEAKPEKESLPFKCFICRQSFEKPVVTKCKHYFCEKCALENYRKSSRCFVCSAQTNGIFNPAKVLIARLKNSEEGDPRCCESSDSE